MGTIDKECSSEYRELRPASHAMCTASGKSLFRVILVLAIVFESACSITPIRPASSLTPPVGDGWETASPQSAGFDEGALQKLTQDIQSGRFPNTHAVLIEYDGRLVYEQYFGGMDERWNQPVGYRNFGRDSLHDLRSVSKTVTSLVLGIVLGAEGDFALEKPLPSFFPKLTASPDLQAVTLHHALTMTAGIQWNEMTTSYASDTNDEVRLYGVTDPVAMVLKRPVVTAPGSVWYYNGGLSQVLAGIVQEKTGKALDKVAAEVLFNPLGIKTFEWIGGPIWEPAMPAAASGLRMRGRDLAKIGSVCLHDGQWEGRQIVPKKWLERSMQRHVEQAGAWSNGGVWGYGYQFWMGRFPQGYEVAAAKGNGDQNVFILRKEKIVVTIFAGAYNRFDGPAERILHRIMAAREPSSNF